MTPRMFPILYPGHELRDIASELRRGGVYATLLGFPWDLLAAHEAQAIANHSQSLERLSARGGLDPSELLSVLRDQAPRWEPLPAINAQRQLLEILDDAGLLPGILR